MWASNRVLLFNRIEYGKTVDYFRIDSKGDACPMKVITSLAHCSTALIFVSSNHGTESRASPAIAAIHAHPQQ